MTAGGTNVKVFTTFSLPRRYDWSPGVLHDGILEASLAQGSQYIPMIWGEADLAEERLRDFAWVSDSAPYLLGFNEPNYQGQVKQ